MDTPGENAIERRRKIFQEYERVISENIAKYGQTEAARQSKQGIYEKVADKLNYSPEWVRKVIASFLKKKK